MALEEQTEKVRDFRACLKNESQKIQRFVDLIFNVDSCSSDDSEKRNLRRRSKTGKNVFNRWPFNTTNNAYDSISSLLMQQRYEELSTSYKRCCKQLFKKDKQLKALKYEKELLQTQYNNLLEKYRLAQTNIEDLCTRYLRLQNKKNHELNQLQDSLT